MIKPAFLALATVCVLTGACDRDAPDARAAAGSNAGERNAIVESDTQVPSSQQGVTAQTSFDLVDQDDDGLVSLEEAKTVDGLDFAAADADESSSLSRQEYSLAMEKARPRG
jgi:hypothetical protein